MESYSDRVMFFTDQGRFHQFSFYIQILATFEEFGHSDHCLFTQGKFPWSFDLVINQIECLI